MQHSHLAPGIKLGYVARQCTQIGRVQFKQFELVVRPQQALDDEGGARVHLGARALVEGAHHVHIGLQ